MGNRDRSGTSDKRPGIPALIFIVLLLSAISIAWTGYLFYGSQKVHLRIEKQKELMAVARVKETQITRWRTERLNDCRATMNNPILSADVRAFLDNRSAESKKRVAAWLTAMYREEDYSDIVLFDARIQPLLALGTDSKTVGDHERNLVRTALETGQILVSDFHETKEYPRIHLDLAVPVPYPGSPRRQEESVQFMAVVFLRLDPSKYLFPLLKEWTSLSITSETLLVKSDDGMAVLMDKPGRQDEKTSGMQRLESGGSGIEQLVLDGLEGITEETDYQGIPVFAAIRRIPESSWFIISKIDRNEVYASLRQYALVMAIIGGLLFLSIVLAATLYLKYQSSRFYRQQYETELKQQGLIARFDYLTKFANDIALLFNYSGNIVDVNERALTVYGYRRAEFLELNAYDLRAHNAEQSLDTSMKSIEEHGGLVFETYHRKKDGTSFPVEVSARIVETEGKKFYQSIVRDISERKRAEEILKDRESQYRTFLDSMADMAFMKDDLFRHLMANKTLLEYFGKTEVEVLGRTDFELMPEEAARHCRATDITTLDIKNILVEEEKVGERIFETRKFPVALENGRIGIGGYIRDVTIRKKAIQGLEESEEKFRAIAETAASAIFIIQDNTFQYINPAFETITGYSPDDLKGLDFWKIISPEDRERSRVRGLARLRGEEAPQRYEFRVIMKDGLEKWVDFSASTANIGGKPAILGTAIDITERKFAETELRNSEEKYRLLVENASEAIIVAQDGFIKFANPKMAEISGYSSDELASRSFEDFIHPEDRTMVSSKHYSRLAGKEHETYAFRAVNKSNETKWLEINAVSFSWSGKPATLNFLNDVTARKHSEQALRESFENLHRMTEGIIEALARTTETRDPYTAGHQRRVAKLVVALSGELNMDPGETEGIRVAALLHDVGKIAVPAEILCKPGRLSDYEFSILKIHSRTGYEIVKDINFPWPVALAILQHHERLDGSGYPDNIPGENITMEARILGVADVVESMASHRPYRPALGTEAALEQIIAYRNIYYDPLVVDACVSLFRNKAFSFD